MSSITYVNNTLINMLDSFFTVQKLWQWYISKTDIADVTKCSNLQNNFILIQ
jgi:hypothetical protein